MATNETLKIAGLKLKIDGTAEFNKTLEQLNLEFKKSSAELSKVTAEYGKGSQAAEVLSARHTDLSNKVSTQHKITEKLKEILAQTAKEFGENSFEAEKLRVKIAENEAAEIRFQTRLDAVTAAIVENQKAQEASNVTVDTSTEKITQLNEQLKLTGQEYQKSGESISKWGKEVQDAGKGISTYITAPLAAMGGLATKASVDFESAFAGVRKTVDTTEQGYKRLSDAIRKMSTEIPASAEAIAQVAENAGQLGIAENNITSFTRTMIDLGESTNVSSNEASSSLAKFANITRMSQDDFDRLGSVIVKLGNNFATTEKDIVAMGMRLAGAGANVGMTQAQIMALATALSSMGIEAEAGGSSVSKVIATMQIAVETGGNKLKQFASVAGMSAEQFATAFRENAAQALTAFIVGLGNLKEQGESTIVKLDEMGLSEIRVRDALLRASGANEILTESLTMSSTAWEENTALSNEAAERYKTTASQFQILENNVAEAARSLGDGFLPYLNKLLDMAKPTIESMKEAAEGFKNLSEWQQETVIKTGLFVAAIGPAIFGLGKVVEVAGTAKTILGVFAESLAVVKTGAAASSASVSALAAAINLLKGPVGLITLGVGAAAAGWSLYRNAQEEARQEIINTGKELQSLRDKVDESTTNLSSIDQLIGKWERLNGVISSNTASSDELRTAKEELEKVENMLIDASGGIITNYDIENGLMAERIPLLQENLELERLLAVQKLQQKLNDTDIAQLDAEVERLRNKRDVLEDTSRKQEEAFVKLKQLVLDYNTAANESSEALAAFAENTEAARSEIEGILGLNLTGVLTNLEGALETANGTMKETTGEFKKTKEECDDASAAQRSYNQQLEDLEKLKAYEYVNMNTDAISGSTGATNDNTDALADNNNAGEYQIKTLEQLQKEREELSKVVSDNISELDGLNKVYSETSKSQELNTTQLLDMIEKYPAVAEYINLTGDATLNNGEIIKQVAGIRKQDLINTLELRKQDLENELTTAKAKLDAVSQEYSEKARIVKAYYSAFGAAGMGESIAGDIMNDPALKAATEAYNTISKSLSGVEAQLKVVNQITIKATDNLETVGSKSAASMNKAAKEAERAAKEAETLAIKVNETNDKLKDAADSTQAFYENALGASDKAVEESKNSTIKAVTDSAKKSKDAMEEVVQHKEKIAELSGKINEIMLQEQTKTTESEIKKLTKELDETVKLAEKASETAVKEAAKTTEEIVRANEDALNLLGNGLTNALKSSYDEMNNDQQEFIDRQLDSIKEGIYQEVQLSKDASMEKIQVWDDEYFARLSQIDGIEAAYIESVRAQINAELTAIAERDAKISGNIAIQNAKSEEAKREMERLKNERELKQHQERLKELDEAISSAKTDEERSRASKRKQDYLDDIAYQTELKKLQDEYNTALEETQKLKKEQAENIKLGQESIKKIETDNIKEMETLLKALKEGWSDYYKNLSEDADMLAADMIKDFENNQDLIVSLLNAYNPKWREEGKSFIDYFQEGIDSGEIDIAELVKNIDKAIDENKPEESLSDLVMIDNDELDENIKEAAKTMESNKDEMKKSSQKLADAARLPLENFKNDTYRLGQDSAQGYANGMLSKLELIKSTAASLATASQVSIAQTNDSHSPSRVTRKLARDFGDGYIFGMLDRIAGIRQTSRLLAEASIVSLEPSRTARKGSVNGSVYEAQEGRGQINLEVNVNVAKVDATNERDIQALGEQLAFVIKKKLVGTGDA